MAAQARTVERDDRLLRSALVIDAAASGVTGAGMIAASGPVARFLGIEPGWIPAAIGAGLIGWALFVFGVARKPEIQAAMVREIIAGNLLWVTGSLLVLLIGLPELTTEGSWAVAIVAEGVALFALLQYHGLRRMRSGLLA